MNDTPGISKAHRACLQVAEFARELADLAITEENYNIHFSYLRPTQNTVRIALGSLIDTRNRKVFYAMNLRDFRDSLLRSKPLTSVCLTDYMVMEMCEEMDNLAAERGIEWL